jgi:septum formation inhibitor-activating ATPase MinD
VPTVVLTTRGGFHNLTMQVASAFGLSHPRVVVVDHPLGGVEEDVIIGRAHAIVEDVLRLWTT